MEEATNGSHKLQQMSIC